jgi:hypothetical protein
LVGDPRKSCVPAHADLSSNAADFKRRARRCSLTASSLYSRAKFRDGLSRRHQQLCSDVFRSDDGLEHGDVESKTRGNAGGAGIRRHGLGHNPCISRNIDLACREAKDSWRVARRRTAHYRTEDAEKPSGSDGLGLRVPVTLRASIATDQPGDEMPGARKMRFQSQRVDNCIRCCVDGSLAAH